jgi:hypothetical protein
LDASSSSSGAFVHISRPSAYAAVHRSYAEWGNWTGGTCCHRDYPTASTPKRSGGNTYHLSGIAEQVSPSFVVPSDLGIGIFKLGDRQREVQRVRCQFLVQDFHVGDVKLRQVPGTSQVNELLLKVLAYNIVVVIHSRVTVPGLSACTQSAIAAHNVG